MRVPCAAELLCARIPHAAVAWKRVGFVARRFADEKRVFLPCRIFWRFAHCYRACDGNWASLAQNLSVSFCASERRAKIKSHARVCIGIVFTALKKQKDRKFLPKS